jgi:hypothetical protein
MKDRNEPRNRRPARIDSRTATAAAFHRATYAHDSATTADPTIAAPQAAVASPRTTGVQPAAGIPALAAIGPHAPIGRARL